MRSAPIISGRLYSDKIIDNTQASVKISDFNVPKIEPHYSFLISSDVTEPVDQYKIQSKIAGMVTSFEISDTRFTEKIENSSSEIGDYIADNARSGILFIGEKVNWLETYLAGVKPTITRNGEQIQEASQKKYSPLLILENFLNESLKANREIKR